ncbi:MAG: hypothetical protein IJY27_01690 [Clostridia bacterium]|nr:hypothetical protein [Clostridia bacterium]
MYRSKNALTIIMVIILVAVSCTTVNATNHVDIFDNNASLLSSNNIACYHNYTTNETKTIDLSSITNYDYQCTHECLSQEELAITQAADAAYFDEVAAISSHNASPLASTSSGLTVVTENDDILYKGVVLIVSVAENDDGDIEYTQGTGFMVSSNVVVTSAHLAAPLLDEGWRTTEVRVYPHIDYVAPTATPLSSLNSYSYVTVSTAIFGLDAYDSDWYVGTLSSNISNIYLFNCYSVDSSIIGTTTYSVGYGSSTRFRRLESQGQVVNVLTSSNNLQVSNYMEPGMSGGPIYAHVGGRSCIAINRAGTDPSFFGTMITDTLLDIIIDSILDA